MRLVNLGCGGRFHPDWINIDVAASGPGVIVHDLSQGIPLGDGECDVVYHSNVLEHFRREDAPAFLRECARVLKPGGVLRVGVPDLERIARIYLEKLEGALRGDEGSKRDYEWILLEMYDQAVRESPGGGMLEYLRRDPLPNEKFVFERIGEEGREMVKGLRKSGVARGYKPKRSIKTLFKALLGERWRRIVRIGRFRLSGEVHHWMYDRHSLSELLKAAGFRDPAVTSAAASRIPGWRQYHLDTLEDGTVIKPDSFFMEAIRG